MFEPDCTTTDELYKNVNTIPEICIVNYHNQQSQFIFLFGSGDLDLYNDRVTMDFGSFCAVPMRTRNSTDQTFTVNVVADVPWQANLSG